MKPNEQEKSFQQRREELLKSRLVTDNGSQSSQYLESLIEDVVLNGVSFDNQLPIFMGFAENEGLDANQLKNDIVILIDILKSVSGQPSRSEKMGIVFQAQRCHISEEVILRILSELQEKKKKEQEEAEKRAREKAQAERRAREKAEAERRAREQEAEAEKRAREKAEAERRAREKAEAERRAREKAETEKKAREKAEALFQQWANYYPPGTGYDYKKSEERISLLMESAALGYPKAQNFLSHAYRFGLGVKRNFEEAFRLSMASALQDNRGGQCDVGVAYLYGNGVEPNDELAFSWLNKSAQAGNPLGMTYLAICYQYGIGTPRDLEYASKLISQAEELYKGSKNAKLPSRIMKSVTYEVIEECRKEYYEENK